MKRRAGGSRLPGRQSVAGAEFDFLEFDGRVGRVRIDPAERDWEQRVAPSMLTIDSTQLGFVNCGEGRSRNMVGGSIPRSVTFACGII